MNEQIKDLLTNLRDSSLSGITVSPEIHIFTCCNGNLSFINNDISICYDAKTFEVTEIIRNGKVIVGDEIVEHIEFAEKSIMDSFKEHDVFYHANCELLLHPTYEMKNPMKKFIQLQKNYIKNYLKRLVRI